MEVYQQDEKNAQARHLWMGTWPQGNQLKFVDVKEAQSPSTNCSHFGKGDNVLIWASHNMIPGAKQALKLRSTSPLFNMRAVRCIDNLSCRWLRTS